LSRYCLDTSAYSRFREGETRVVALLDCADWIGVPTVVLGELWAGFLQGKRTDENARALRKFLDHPIVHELPVDGDVARLYGEILAELRGKGTPAPTNDMWVAATAARAGASVLTYDEHFRRIGRVGTIFLETEA
jgi:predicted nucleic acid-binding protein